MVKFLPLLSATLLITLFVVALLNGALIMAELNNPENTIADHPAIIPYLSLINDTLLSYSGDTRDAQESLDRSGIVAVFTVIFDAIKGIWKTLTGGVVVMYNLTAQFLLQTIGGPEFVIVLGVLGSIFTLAIIITVWRLAHTGDGG